jgi:hypothetical protein
MNAHKREGFSECTLHTSSRLFKVVSMQLPFATSTLTTFPFNSKQESKFLHLHPTRNEANLSQQGEAKKSLNSISRRINNEFDNESSKLRSGQQFLHLIA